MELPGTCVRAVTMLSSAKLALFSSLPESNTLKADDKHVQRTFQACQRPCKSKTICMGLKAHPS